jgi:glycerol-3-phosphate cytidylyltransferase-like family protein
MAEQATEVQKARTRLLENRKWVDENIEDLQKQYKNKWLTVRDKKIIDSGDNPGEVKAKIEKKFADETLLIFVPNVIAKPM